MNNFLCRFGVHRYKKCWLCESEHCSKCQKIKSSYLQDNWSNEDKKECLLYCIEQTRRFLNSDFNKEHIKNWFKTTLNYAKEFNVVDENVYNEFLEDNDVAYALNNIEYFIHSGIV